MGFNEILDWLCNQNNITFVIAVLGFAMSVYNFTESLLRKRRKVRVDFAHVFRAEGRERCVDMLHMKVYNLSGREIVTSRITVENSHCSGGFGAYRRQLLRSARTITRSSGELERKEMVWMSDHLPVKIEGGGFANLILMADTDGQFIALKAPNVVKLHTPSGVVKKKLTISDFSEKGLLGECRAPD